MKKTTFCLFACSFAFHTLAQEAISVAQLKTELSAAKDEFMTMPAPGSYYLAQEKGTLYKISAQGKEKICDFSLPQKQIFLKQTPQQVYILTESTYLNLEYYRLNPAPASGICDQTLPVDQMVSLNSKDFLFNQVLNLFDSLETHPAKITRQSRLVYQLSATADGVEFNEKMDFSQGFWKFAMSLNSWVTGSRTSGDDLQADYAYQIVSSGQLTESADLSKATLCEDKNNDGVIEVDKECTLDWDRSLAR